MFTIKGPAVATPYAQEVRNRHMLPTELAALTSCAGLWMVRDEWITASGGFISAISSRTVAANPMVQATGGRQPSVVFDADLNRNTALFLDDFTTYMAAASFNYTLPFTLVSVFKANNNPAKALQGILGRYGAAAPDRAFITLRAAGTVGGIYGTSSEVYPTFTHYGDEWGVVIMGYDGTSQLTVQYNGMAPQTITCTVEAAGITQMQMGYNASGGASFSGRLDMGGAWSENFFDSGNAAKLASLRGLISTYYQGVVQA